MANEAEGSVVGRRGAADETTGTSASVVAGTGVIVTGIDAGDDAGASAGDSDSKIGTGVEAGTIGKSGATVANCESGSVTRAGE